VARWKTKLKQKKYLPELSVCRPILAINPPHNTTPKFASKTRRNPTNQLINQSYKHIASSSLLHLLPGNLQRAQQETGKIDLEKQQNETKRNQETEKRNKVRSSNKNLLLPEHTTDVCEAKTGR
jgi:DNA gyrase/topoisomerase IV subunit B